MGASNSGPYKAAGLPAKLLISLEITGVNTQPLAAAGVRREASDVFQIVPDDLKTPGEPFTLGPYTR